MKNDYSVDDAEYFSSNCKKIVENRAYATAELKKLGFISTDSLANFLFVKHEKIGGERLYQKLKEKGVLVRHFTSARIADYNRITVGSRREMEILLDCIKTVLEEQS